jgi:hypothetical protein
VRATKLLQPGDQLLTRYGHDYWLRRAHYLPRDLVHHMYNKYRPTLTSDPEALPRWQAMLQLCSLINTPPDPTICEPTTCPTRNLLPSPPSLPATIGTIVLPELPDLQMRTAQ